ncbi:hypothetical protein [Clostridium sp. AWRP]|uniref:hypothetical protein n=1 Tax=Clostridium sp. AWRP TaxID=2212991 RepID=UPI000FDC3394|nr:hypothetical protein [Clostridium sp. AWRP]AZV57962.1 hypothetical protein DMR38_15870 [Clostridium sp. AWRP]
MKINSKNIYTKNSNYISNTNTTNNISTFKSSMDEAKNKLSGSDILRNAPDSVVKSWDNVVNSLSKEDRLDAGIAMFKLNELNMANPNFNSKSVNSFSYGNFNNLLNSLVNEMKRQSNLLCVDEKTRIANSKELYILNKFKQELAKYNL